MEENEKINTCLSNTKNEDSLDEDDEVTLDYPSIREVSIIQPQIILYPPSQWQKTQNKPIFGLESPNNNVSQQPGFVTHIYNNTKNPQPRKKKFNNPHIS